MNIILAVLFFWIGYYALFVPASAGLFAVIIYTIAAVKDRRIKKAGGKPEHSVKVEIAVLAVFAVHFVVAFVLCRDAPPIQNDYTSKDLLYPGEEFAETWELLNSLADKEGDPNIASGIGVSVNSEGKFPLYYKAYNAIGSMLVEIMQPAIEKVRKIKMRVLIRDDLLQVVLAMRLGEEYGLEARAYSEEYVVDSQRKMIYSPGPDGLDFTKDDIKLPIDPQVLGIE